MQDRTEQELLVGGDKQQASVEWGRGRERNGDMTIVTGSL